MADSSTPPGLLDLPPEARSLIYQNVFADSKIRKHYEPASAAHPFMATRRNNLGLYRLDLTGTDSSITRSCRQLRTESLPTLFSCAKFSFCYSSYRQSWGDEIPDIAHDSYHFSVPTAILRYVRNLSIPWEFHLDKLLPDLTNLKALTIKKTTTLYAQMRPLSAGDDKLLLKIAVEHTRKQKSKVPGRQKIGDLMESQQQREYKLYVDACFVEAYTTRAMSRPCIVCQSATLENTC